MTVFLVLLDYPKSITSFPSREGILPLNIEGNPANIFLLNLTFTNEFVSGYSWMENNFRPLELGLSEKIHFTALKGYKTYIYTFIYKTGPVKKILNNV